MNKSLALILALVAIILIGILIFFPRAQAPQTSPTEITNLEQDLSAFSRINNPLPLTFPQDMGAHPDYLSEWWYYTGNLFTEQGRHFAYQLTFFRRAIGSNSASTRTSNWAADQIFFAHFALIDVAESNHQAWEVYSRGAAGLAGAVTAPDFTVWLNDWQVQQTAQDQYQLTAQQDNIHLQLTLTDQKGIILHGDQGLSQKGAQPGNASMYFSQTRLASAGVLTINDNTYRISGDSWMDHEFGTSALGSEQVGWDWFSLQFDDQSELMLFQIRDDSGAISAESGGSWIDPQAGVESIASQDFELRPIQFWQNAQGIQYPISWELKLPQQNAVFTISAVIPDQENRFSFFQYWEGTVRVEGTVNGNSVTGFGFLEMTGYAHSMDGVF